MMVKPQTIKTAAMILFVLSGSFKKTTAMTAPNKTLVSRIAATSGIGATVMAQIAIP